MFEACTAWSAEVKRIAKAVNQQVAVHNEGIRHEHNRKIQHEEQVYQGKAFKLTDRFVKEDDKVKGEIKALQDQIKHLERQRNESTLTYRKPQVLNQNGATSGFEMYFAPSTFGAFGAGVPNQNTSRIQYPV